MTKKTVIMVAGGFDPCHRGHLMHIVEASKLGDYLIVAVNSDEDMVRKKGYCYETQWFRKEAMEGLLLVHKISGRVINVIDRDGTVAETLRKIKPTIFAKGGDRVPGNMPKSELDVCKELGIEIRYGIGRQLNASSMLAEKIRQHLGGHRYD